MVASLNLTTREEIIGMKKDITYLKEGQQKILEGFEKHEVLHNKIDMFIDKAYVSFARKEEVKDNSLAIDRLRLQQAKWVGGGVVFLAIIQVVLQMFL